MNTLSLRRVRLLALIVASFALLVPAAPAQTAGATVTQDGWWNRFQGPVEVGPVTEPANPLRSTINPTLPKPPTVPDNAIAVGASGAEPTSVGAVGFIVEASPGATVTTLKLTLKEAPSGQQNAAGAVIVACPITSFWAGAKNGRWADRPSGECADPAAAKGVRAADGTWSFDLTALGQSYVDALLEPNGVLLAPAQGASGPFQVSFLDNASNGVAVAFSASGGGLDTGTPGIAPTPETSPDPVVEAPLEAPLSADSLPLPEDVPVPVTGAVPAAPPLENEVAQPVARTGRAADLTDIPLVALLLLPIAGLVAFAIAYSLGPAGRPDVTSRRSGGVSRALAGRAAQNRS